MEILKWLFFIAVVLLVGGPAFIRIIRNIALGIKLRRRLKSVPGPLLGVVYPEYKDLYKKEANK